jgi:hypothetical protein
MFYIITNICSNIKQIGTLKNKDEEYIKQNLPKFKGVKIIGSN